jgi:pantothenate kinase-related protein Tda10
MEGPSDQELIDNLPYADQAPFDSKTKQDDQRCLDDTRTEVLKEIRAWVYGEEKSHIFWLSGALGTGKSTIARTIAHIFNTEKSWDQASSLIDARVMQNTQEGSLQVSLDS